MAEFAGTPIYIVHVTCRARRRGDHRRPRARRRRDRRDLHPVPDARRRRPLAARPGRLRGRPLRLLAAAARRRSTSRSCGTRSALDHLADRLSTDHCPFNDEQKRARPGRLLEDPERPGADPAPREPALGARRPARDGCRRAAPSSCSRPRRPASSASRSKGALAPGKDADIAILDPEPRARLLARHVADGGRLRPASRAAARRQRPHHARARHDGLGRRQDPHAARATAGSCAARPTEVR